MLRRLLLAVYVLCQYSGHASIEHSNSTIFSGPPSGLPIRKIYVHNRPVYVRQMFVSPQRRHIEFGTSEFRGSRMKRLGFAPIIPPIVPPSVPQASAASSSAAAASYPGYAQSYAPQYSQYSSSASNAAVSSFSNSFSAAQSAPAPAFAPSAFAVAAPVPSIIAPLPIAPQPIEPLQPIQPEPIEPAIRYPLPQCYTDRSNFMCCNRTLENIMHDSFDELRASRPGWSSCNIHQLATLVQKKAEALYNTTFEVITGVGDYASKSHFYSDLICKVENDGKFVLAYATPRPDAEDADGDEFGDGTAYSEKPPLHNSENGDNPQSYNSGNGDTPQSYNSGNGDNPQSYNSGNSENSLGGDGTHRQNGPPYHKNYVWRS